MSDRWLPEDTSKLDMGSITIELGGVAEIAAMLGVTRAAVSNWDTRRVVGFPQPLARLAAGPVYNLAEIRAWWDTVPGEVPS